MLQLSISCVLREIQVQAQSVPSYLLSVCPAYETRVGVGDRRSLVFACEGVWMG
jgi:hypothetical protein